MIAKSPEVPESDAYNQKDSKVNFKVGKLLVYMYFSVPMTKYA